MIRQVELTSRDIHDAMYDAEQKWKRARNDWLRKYGVSDDHAYGCCRNTARLIGNPPSCEFRKDGYYTNLCPNPVKYLAIQKLRDRWTSVTLICGDHSMMLGDWAIQPVELIRLDTK